MLTCFQETESRGFAKTGPMIMNQSHDSGVFFFLLWPLIAEIDLVF